MKSNIIKEDISIIADSIKQDVKKLEDKTLLISGGAGFIGSYIIRVIDQLNSTFLTKPCKVISIDNYVTGRKRRLSKDINTNYIKLKKKDVTRSIFIPERIDYIIHAAGLASPFYYQKYPIETMESAIYGTRNLLSLAHEKKVKSFLYFSSSEIYGNPDKNSVPTPESYNGSASTIGPRACYDESKRMGETLCMVYFNIHKIPIKIVRPFNIYGPGMFVDDYRVIPTFISSALCNKPLLVHGNGTHTRTFCYISDAITGFLKVLLLGEVGDVYNVGNNDREISILELAKLISGIFNNKVEVKTVPYPSYYPKDGSTRRCPDLTKIKSKLGYIPRINLDKGLKRFINWCKDEYNL